MDTMVPGVHWVMCAVISMGVCYGSDWGYQGRHGPCFWAEDYPACGNRRQSPVHIVTSTTVYDYSLTPVHYTGYAAPLSDVKFLLQNNGHSVGVTLVHRENQEYHRAIIQHAGLDGLYTLEQFHFHWGSVDTQGSEHVVDNLAYPAELHLVHKHVRHNTISEALDDASGLAVLGIFIKVWGNVDNQAFARITNYLDKVKYEDNSTNIPVFALNELLPADRRRFFRYEGSLTTPPCSEAAVWTVFKDSVTISERQMMKLRGLRSDDRHHMVDNFRPTVPLHDRTISTNFKTQTNTYSGFYNKSTALIGSSLLVCGLSAGFIFYHRF